MKKILMVMAVALMSALMFTSCDSKNDPNNIVGTWENEEVVSTNSGQATRKVVFTFDATNVNYTYYFNGEISGGNGGTYTFSAPNVTLSYTVPVRTITGTLKDGQLTINTEEFGAVVCTKKTK